MQAGDPDQPSVNALLVHKSNQYQKNQWLAGQQQPSDGCHQTVHLHAMWLVDALVQQKVNHLHLCRIEKKQGKHRPIATTMNILVVPGHAQKNDGRNRTTCIGLNGVL